MATAEKQSMVGSALKLKNQIQAKLNGMFKAKAKPGSHQLEKASAKQSALTSSTTNSKRKANAKSKSKSKTKAQHHKKIAKADKDELKSSNLADPALVNPMHAKDPAHSPGHRKMNVKSQFSDATGEKVQIQESARNRMTRADRINRVTDQRRIDSISAASAGNRRTKSTRGAD